MIGGIALKRLFSILLGVMMMFTLTVSASALSIFDTLFPDNLPTDIQGTAPISEGAASYIYQEYTGLSADDINAYCVFVTDYENRVVWVYDTNGVKHDVVYYNADDMIYSYGLDYAVKRSELVELENNTEMAFYIASKGFGFLLSNPVMALCLCIQFAIFGLSLLFCVMRTAKRP